MTGLQNEQTQRRKNNETGETINELLQQIVIPSGRRLLLDHINTALRNIVSTNQACNLLEEAEVSLFIKRENNILSCCYYADIITSIVFNVSFNTSWWWFWVH